MVVSGGSEMTGAMYKGPRLDQVLPCWGFLLLTLAPDLQHYSLSNYAHQLSNIALLLPDSNEDLSHVC